jgi:4-hydroxybenzoate polyprenyltransferase
MAGTDQPGGIRALVARVRLVHPYPSFVNAALVFGLAGAAGGEPLRTAQLALAMLGLQFCIGVVNDLVDQPIDAVAKRWKPLAAGLVSRRTATAIALAAGGGGLLLAAQVSPAVLAMYLAMLGCGLGYDFWLKPTAWAWLCFSIAFAILPVYAWYGAVGDLPPRTEFVLLLAALAGPIILLSNGLADLERDRASGVATLPARLGDRRSLVVIAILLAMLHGLAWLTLPMDSAYSLALVAASSLTAASGFALLAIGSPALREVGWMLQAGSLALLGLGWLTAAVA